MQLPRLRPSPRAPSFRSVAALATLTGAVLASLAAAGPDAVEVQVSTADGFQYSELAGGRAIVMLPVSEHLTDREHARRLSALMDRNAPDNRFVTSGEVESVLQGALMASAFDSLLTAVASIQPATSFSLLSSLADRFSAGHALVPVNVAVDNADKHYALDVMFVLVDLGSGRPRLIMSAGDAINGKQARRPAEREKLEADTLAAVLGVLAKRD